MGGSDEAKVKLLKACEAAGPEFTVQRVLERFNEEGALIEEFPDAWRVLITTRRVELVRAGEECVYRLRTDGGATEGQFAEVALD